MSSVNPPDLSPTDPTASPLLPEHRVAWRDGVERELRANILPFWIEHVAAPGGEGFMGGLTNDLRVLDDVPRAAVVVARILWTYAAASRLYGKQAYSDMARRAYAHLAGPFRDPLNGGVFWTVDRLGAPDNDRKHVYAQAFAIYGLSEYYRATGEPAALSLAQDLFHLIDAHSFDSQNGGNIECLSRTWGVLDDMRLSPKEPDCRKSMNTLLHLVEAYANLLRVWNDALLRARLAGLLDDFLEHVIDPTGFHFRLFFDDAWHSLPGRDNRAGLISPGHDIEGSWLLLEAAEVVDHADLLERTRAVAVQMAEVVYRDGLDADGSVVYEVGPAGVLSYDRHWWGQAEGMVGFFNAFQLSGQSDFATASYRLWTYIQAHFVDREHGDWFKVLDRAGTPYPDQLKVGPWECPYHHSRACMEMLRRLV